MADPDLASAAALLRSAGWVVTEPPDAEIPRVEVGQVWRREGSYNKRRVLSVNASEIIYVASDIFWPRASGHAVWNAWARKSGARPVEA